MVYDLGVVEFLFDDFCRRTRYHRIRRYVFGDQAVGSDDTPSAQANSGQNGRSRAQPYVFFDDDISRLVIDMGCSQNELRNSHRASMVVGHNSAIGCEFSVFFYDDFLRGRIDDGQSVCKLYVVLYINRLWTDNVQGIK